MSIKTFDIDGDDFQFELFNPKNTEISSLFEASDPEDLNLWLNVIQKQILRHSDGDSITQSPKNTTKVLENVSRSGFLTKAPHDKNYWFSIRNSKLEWFYAQGDHTPVGVLPLHYCNIKQLSTRSFQLQSPELEEIIQLQIPPEDTKPEEWVENILAAKKNYWRSNAMLNSVSKDFTNRGYIMKLEGKRWIRRWFVLINRYLLFFKGPKV